MWSRACVRLCAVLQTTAAVLVTLVNALLGKWPRVASSLVGEDAICRLTQLPPAVAAPAAAAGSAAATPQLPLEAVKTRLTCAAALLRARQRQGTAIDLVRCLHT